MAKGGPVKESREKRGLSIAIVILHNKVVMIQVNTRPGTRLIDKHSHAISRPDNDRWCKHVPENSWQSSSKILQPHCH
jgi:hypothetical protein